MRVTSFRNPAELAAGLLEQFADSAPEDRARALFEQFAQLSLAEGGGSLAQSYLTFESDLQRASGLPPEDMRGWVLEHAADLIESEPRFGLIFQPDDVQERQLFQLFLEGVLERALPAASLQEQPVLESVMSWVRQVPRPNTTGLPLGLTDTPPESDSGWSALLGRVSGRLYAFLRGSIGVARAAQLYVDTLEDLTEDYAGLESFATVVAKLPVDLVNRSRLQLLGRSQLERVIISHSREVTRLHTLLDEQTRELQRLGRDLRRSRTVAAEAVREFKTVLDAVGEAIVTTDATGTIVMANRAAERTWHCQDDELFGIRIHSLLADGPDSLEQAGLSGGPESFAELVGRQIELKGLRRDGSQFPLTLRVSQTPSGDLVLFTFVARDLSEQKRAEDAIRQAGFALAIEGADHGLWDWDLKTGRVAYSAEWCGLLGLSADQLTETTADWFERIHPDEVERVQSALRAHLEGRIRRFENEHRLRHADGTYRWVLCRGRAVLNERGRPVRLAGSLVDLTERKVTDALTGLPNRVLFMDRLNGAIHRRRGVANYLFAVLFVDLDGFKVINDSLGHVLGDQLLLAIAQRLEACVRSKDTVARMGGDEFTILLDDIADVGDAKRVADRIHKELKAPFYLRRQEVFTTASIGIAMGSDEYEGPEDLLRDADTAMYRAKALGKARYEVFDLAMRDRAVALMELQTDLRRAVERTEFEVHYQPIVSIETGRTQAFEALVRWRHPERGLVSPLDFISVAEETGLIIPIGRWVLREACRQMGRWREEVESAVDGVAISVNLSRRQFAQRDLAAQIEQILADTGLDPRLLKLEITESMIMDDEDYAVEQLTRLRGLEIKVAIDDFGTGYSSLSALHRFPIDMLKIDRSFVRRMTTDPEHVEIVRTIITLAHNLRMEVVAEGVEQPAELELLRQLRCDFWQGYYYTKPVSGPSAVEFLGPAPQALLRPRPAGERRRPGSDLQAEGGESD